MRKLSYVWMGLMLIFTSCLPNNSGDEIAKSFRDDKSFHLVLVKKEEKSDEREAYFYGIDLETKTNTEFYDGSGWMAENFDKFKIGDTLIKDKGKYSITIKRAGKTILIPYIFDGYSKWNDHELIHKVYYDTLSKK
jgi:hypothetical protein